MMHWGVRAVALGCRAFAGSAVIVAVGCGSGGGGEGQADPSEPGGSQCADPNAPLVTKDGWFEASSNCYGIEGALWVATDGYSTVSPSTFDAASGGEWCATGSLAQVVDMQWDTYWGATIGINLEQARDGVAAAYDASAAGVTGFEFAIAGASIPPEIRIQAEDSTGALYCVEVVGTSGTLSFQWADLRQSCWLSAPGPAIDPSEVVWVGVTLVSNPMGPVPFDFCLSSLRVLGAPTTPTTPTPTPTPTEPASCFGLEANATNDYARCLYSECCGSAVSCGEDQLCNDVASCALNATSQEAFNECTLPLEDLSNLSSRLWFYDFYSCTSAYCFDPSAPGPADPCVVNTGCSECVNAPGISSLGTTGSCGWGSDGVCRSGSTAGPNDPAGLEFTPWVFWDDANCPGGGGGGPDPGGCTADSDCGSCERCERSTGNCIARLSCP